MFNIVITADGTAWETDQLMRIDAGRFTEYSGTEAATISSDDQASLANLERVPTLLMYERGTTSGPNPDLVLYGYAREIKKAGTQIQFRFEEHGHLSRPAIEEFAERLGMGRFEFNRTHWAIKDGSIPSGLLQKMSRLHVGERTMFTIFYAWQSDRSQNHHKRFIREALDNVAVRINGDRSCPFEIQIDQDTQGVPGLCDIPATILSKIASSDAFVADLTYIAKSEPTSGDTPRYCSNPNVLFELGFAFRAVGWERVICVLNDRHGPRTEQIFDLDHRRHPITYTLPHESKDRRAVLDELVASLEASLRSIFPLGARATNEPGADDVGTGE